MKANALLEGQLLGYSPTSALANSQAFEQAWFMIAGRYSEDEAAEKAQLLLAESVLSVSTHTDTDVRRIIIIGPDDAPRRRETPTPGELCTHQVRRTVIARVLGTSATESRYD